MARTVDAVAMEQETREGVEIVHMKGRLDALSAPIAEKKLSDVLEKGSHRLLIDCAGINYLSSSGMRALLAIRKKVENLSGQLVLCNITPNVQDIFKMSGFESMFDFALTEADAFAKLSGSSTNEYHS